MFLRARNRAKVAVFTPYQQAVGPKQKFIEQIYVENDKQVRKSDG